MTQGPDQHGVWQRQVWLLGLDANGGYADDGLVLDRATGRALGELVATAFAVAGHPDPPRQAEQPVSDAAAPRTGRERAESGGPTGGRLVRLAAALARAGALTTRAGGPGEHLPRQAGPGGGDQAGGPVGPVVARRSGDGT